MSTDEQVYALLVKANPVPDPEALPEDLLRARPRLHVVESRRTEMQTEQPTREVATPRRQRSAWAYAAAALAAVVVVGGAVLWMLRSDGETVVADEGAATSVAAAAENPSITWDGSRPRYTGPREMVAGTHTFRFENTSEESVSFSWYRRTDDPSPSPDGRLAPPGSAQDTEITLVEGTYVFYVYRNQTRSQLNAVTITVTEG